MSVLYSGNPNHFTLSDPCAACGQRQNNWTPHTALLWYLHPHYNFQAKINEYFVTVVNVFVILTCVYWIDDWNNSLIAIRPEFQPNHRVRSIRGPLEKIRRNNFLFLFVCLFNLRCGLVRAECSFLSMVGTQGAVAWSVSAFGCAVCLCNYVLFSGYWHAPASRHHALINDCTCAALLFAPLHRARPLDQRLQLRPAVTNQRTAECVNQLSGDLSAVQFFLGSVQCRHILFTR